MDAQELILGAGPAGLAAAAGLAAQGIEVLVLERAAVSDGKDLQTLLPESLRLLSMPPGPGDPSCPGVELRAEYGAGLALPFAGARGAGGTDAGIYLTRAELSQRLRRRAEAAGAVLRHRAAVCAVDFCRRDAVVVELEGGERVAAAYLLDAASLDADPSWRQDSLTADELALRVLQQAEFDGVAEGDSPGVLRVTRGSGVWASIRPAPGGGVTVGLAQPAHHLSIARSAAEHFDRGCTQLGAAAGPLQGRRLQEGSEIRVRGAYGVRNRVRSGDRFLVLGDALGRLDPVFGLDLYFALLSASLAAKLLAPVLKRGLVPAYPDRSAYENHLDRVWRRKQSLLRAWEEGRLLRHREDFDPGDLAALFAGRLLDEESPILRMGMLETGANAG